jgi:hypothetical protein
MTDTKKIPSWPADPRGGLFIDFGDGRGRIHESELSGAQREAAGLPILAPQPNTDEESVITESNNG